MRPPLPLIDRINRRRDVRGPDECWPRTTPITRIAIGPTKAHGGTEIRRAVWLVEHGRLPPRYERIEMDCGNPLCLNPKHMVHRTDEERFWDHVDKAGPVPATCPELGRCWMWTSHLLRGYGRFFLVDKVIFAHRYAWDLVKGPIGDPAMFACHRCDNPTCVNPDHMFLGTAKDNNADCIAKGRFSMGKRHGDAVRRAHARKVAARQGVAS